MIAWKKGRVLLCIWSSSLIKALNSVYGNIALISFKDWPDILTSLFMHLQLKPHWWHQKVCYSRSIPNKEKWKRFCNTQLFVKFKYLFHFVEKIHGISLNWNWHHFDQWHVFDCTKLLTTQGLQKAFSSLLTQPQEKS